ncbi:Sugar or nucleoside kinase, ribokinase family [Methylacidimicrobium sp. AP8]|uniref:carbohydrate kinase family protein n=1 Tax=Methylacidimicrobium sp. AP8 TaxID=2730359 RepID=UPI0018BF9E90|nr:carbohydrate kinase family protein [Methylacidimicrobium sp. AP8]CAB4242409.1 Sugar or nucleoside kinase, ribokinase family [Methylacidimicrobium sp. AP8]
MAERRLARQTGEQLLGSRAQLLKRVCLSGFDGLVEESFRVVGHRRSPEQYSVLASVREFLVRLQSEDDAGADRVFELVEGRPRMAGSAPWFSSALGALGVQVHFVGACGKPGCMHRAFAELEKRARVYPVAAPAYERVLEFGDERISFVDYRPWGEITWELVEERVGKAALRDLWAKAHLAAFPNWSRLTHLSLLWRRLLSELCPTSGAPRKLLLFDLGDLRHSTDADVLSAIKILQEFQACHDVVLSLNARESQTVARVLRLPRIGLDFAGAPSAAAALREKIGISTVVIHCPLYAAAADGEGEEGLECAHTAKPRTVLQAGDHFNAGFSAGRLLGWRARYCLQLGIACAGFYVRHAVSPSREELVRFLRAL